MTALRLRLQKEIFDVTEEQLVSYCPPLSVRGKVLNSKVGLKEHYSEIPSLLVPLMDAGCSVSLAWLKAAAHCRAL